MNDFWERGCHSDDTTLPLPWSFRGFRWKSFVSVIIRHGMMIISVCHGSRCCVLGGRLLSSARPLPGRAAAYYISCLFFQPDVPALVLPQVYCTYRRRDRRTLPIVNIPVGIEDRR